jgi:hypothetical protein
MPGQPEDGGQFIGSQTETKNLAKSRPGCAIRGILQSRRDVHHMLISYTLNIVHGTVGGFQGMLP